MSNRQIASTVWTLTRLFIALTAIVLAGTLAFAGSIKGRTWQPFAVGVTHLSLSGLMGTHMDSTILQPSVRANPNLEKPILATWAEQMEVTDNPLTMGGIRATNLNYSSLRHWSNLWPPMSNRCKLPKRMETTQLKMPLGPVALVAGLQVQVLGGEWG